MRIQYKPGVKHNERIDREIIDMIGTQRNAFLMLT